MLLWKSPKMNLRKVSVRYPFSDCVFQILPLFHFPLFDLVFVVVFFPEKLKSLGRWGKKKREKKKWWTLPWPPTASSMLDVLFPFPLKSETTFPIIYSYPSFKGIPWFWFQWKHNLIFHGSTDSMTLNL